MKSYNNLFEKVVSIENIKCSIDKASKGKRTREDVLAVNQNIDNEAQKIRDMLIRDEYQPTKNMVHTINEDSNMKVRRIRKPHFAYDQIIHHAVIRVMEPIFLKGMYEHVCGSVPKRGAHSGKKRIEKWIRNDVKNTRYCFKCDIRHFYASIDKDILKSMLSKKIRDKQMLNLLFKIIDSCDEGIPLGYYTSQWFANFYLQGLDYYIKQELHADYYIRYADDIVIFGPNKKALHTIRKDVEMYMARNLHLQMKRNWQIFRVEYKATKKSDPDYVRVIGRKLDYMGFLFNHEHTTLRKRGLLSITRKAAKLGKKKKINWYEAGQMLSHMVKLRHSETRHIYEERVKPYIAVKQLKHIVSVHQRKENERERIAMESARRLPRGKTA